MPDDSKSPETEAETNEAGKQEAGQNEGDAALNAIGDTLAEDMPQVQQHAIDQAEDEAKKSATGAVDVDGHTFDPAMHKTGTDGKPTITKLGKLIKKPGRKPGSAATSTLGAAINKSDKARRSGIIAANFLMSTATAVGGEDWQPRKETPEMPLDEKSMMQDAFGDYFDAKGWEDIPPGLALLGALAIYISPRLTAPSTKRRVGGLRGWLARRKGKKVKKAPETAKTEEKAEAGEKE